MKNQWPFWLFVIAIIVVVFISMNYHGKNKEVSLGDIFPEGQKVLDYEYVSGSTGEQPSESKEVVKSEPAPAPVPKAEAPKEAMMPVKKEKMAESSKVVTPKETKPVETTVIKKGLYTIQILSSKDQKAAEQALAKAKEHGLDQAYLQSVDLGEKGTWYRIYVGGYQTMSEAKQALAGIDKTHYAGAFINKAK